MVLRLGSLYGLSLSLLSLSTLHAQVQTIVSPVGTATVEGSTANAFPWLVNNSTSSSAVNVPRYMQIHSDLGVGVKVIQRLSFRRNGTSATQTGTRAIDLELWLGNAVDYDKCSWVYANNWVSPPTQVLSRQIVNIGPLTTPGTPAPFEISIPIAPFVYTSAHSLAWDAQIHGNVETAPMVTLLDADAASSSLTPASVLIGTGCTATGQNAAMTLGLAQNEAGGTWTLGGVVDLAPKLAPLVVAFGATNPNLPVQGLCGNLHTDVLALLALGITDANGFFGVTSRQGAVVSKGPGGPFAFAVPNTLSGQTLYVQAHAVDAASTWPIQLTNSNGRSVQVPTANPTKVVRCTRLFHTDGAPTAPWASCLQTAPSAAKVEPGSVGYALVTAFTY